METLCRIWKHYKVFPHLVQVFSWAPQPPEALKRWYDKKSLIPGGRLANYQVLHKLTCLWHESLWGGLVAPGLPLSAVPLLMLGASVFAQTPHPEVLPAFSTGYLLQYSGPENSTDREPGGLQSMGSQRVGHDWTTFIFYRVVSDPYGSPCVGQAPVLWGTASKQLDEFIPNLPVTCLGLRTELTASHTSYLSLGPCWSLVIRLFSFPLPGGQSPHWILLTHLFFPKSTLSFLPTSSSCWF